MPVEKILILVGILAVSAATLISGYFRDRKEKKRMFYEIDYDKEELGV